jgi:RNA polymerase primary sigma factor
VYVHDQLLRLARATRLLSRETGREPSLTRLADELAWDKDHVAFLQGLVALVPSSLDAPSFAGEGDPVIETIASSDETPETLLEGDEITRQVREALRRLPPRMRAIVTLRNGIGGGDPETLENVGQSYGLTRERIRQIEAKAMDRLRRILPPMIGLPPPSQIEKPSMGTVKGMSDKGNES